MEKVVALLQEINERLAQIEADLRLLTEENQSVKTNCQKMGMHIDFVHGTYEVVRSPLNYLKKKLEFIMGSPGEPELLSICQTP